MKKTAILISTFGAVWVAAGVIGPVGAGIASAAPDVVGMTYSDAVATIQEWGGTAKVSVTVGSRQDAMGECLVTSATDAPFVRDFGGSFGHVGGEVMLAMNCNRGVASATVPGASAASPAGRSFQAKIDAVAAARQAELDALANASEPQGDADAEIPE
ncbi:hypothetical protein ABQF34_29965 [Mycolicibacterium boenickei]